MSIHENDWGGPVSSSSNNDHSVGATADGVEFPLLKVSQLILKPEAVVNSSELKIRVILLVSISIGSGHLLPHNFAS